MTEVLRVIEPGMLTTIQDLGRPHAITAGVPPGGPMDRFAHRAANLLAGNAEGEATLESTMSGPHLVAERACVVAITGGDLGPAIDGEPAPMWKRFVLDAGDRLSFNGRRVGARAYIAIRGGIEADRWLGSVSTNLMAARGGLHGRSLRAGDVIATARDRSEDAAGGRELAPAMRPDYTEHTLYAIAGPHIKRFDSEGRKLLFGAEFRVSHEANRMGYRLEGPVLASIGDELLSFGLTAGAIQVARSGLPILLMADHQTAGGYPVPATVVSASLPVAAQLAPGDTLTFREVTPAQALQMRAALLAALLTIRD